MNFRKIQPKLFLLLVLLLPVQLGRHFWPNWSYVIGLRVDYLSPTIFLTDILVFLIILTWLLGKPKLQINLKSFFLPFSIFIFLLVNALLAQNQGAALYKYFKILEFSLLSLYVAKNFLISQYPNILISLSLAVIYSSLLAIAQFIKQASLGGPFWFLGERTFNTATPGIARAVVNGRLLMRPYATFPHPNALAGFLLVSLILTTPFIFKKSKIVVIGYSMLAISALVLTFSRAVWLVGLLIIFYIIFRQLRISNCGLIIFSGEAFIQRAELNKVALQLIKQHPLSGVGLNNFIPQLPRFWSNPNPIYLLQPVHNIYLLIAVETGLVGLLIFLWFIYLTFKKLNAKSYTLIAALGAILTLGFFDHYWLTLQQTQLLFAIVLGLLWVPKKISI